ncbi:MAG: aminodeoxychorismate synthase component I [Candidatus Anammoxibacter sp.]
MPEIIIRELQNPITPLEIIKQLSNYPDFFFLDSALTGNEYSKYSFLGIEPFFKIKYLDSKIIVEDTNGTKEINGNPFEQLRYFLNSYKIDVLKNESNVIDFPFIGGAVGYFSYDMCHFIEKVPNTTKDDLGFPDMYFGFYDTFVAIDHLKDKRYVVSLNINNNGDTEKKIERLINIVSDKNSDAYGTDNQPDHKGLTSPLTSNFTKKEYIKAVKKAKEYIKAGDIYQVNLSQRFETRTTFSPFNLYERLRNINPAPYSSFIGFDDLSIISSSPERYLSVKATNNSLDCKRKSRVQIRPIKGTRQRHNDKTEDAQAKDELFSSPKDDAELTMIVDLERNDLGRVCDYGSVKVVEKKVLESFATVHHLVSTIEGDLNKNFDVIDLIKATFPGGSITGAPKIRAMHIIDELESTKRSVYTGAIGYIGFNGNVDLSMAIRTFLMNGDKVCFQVGGAIVADSDPLVEYEETMHKAYAMIKAIKGKLKKLGYVTM